ncbi:MAG TPA: hypothetical protein DCM40_25865, partial [Maribacter sp.]|nr:hypothetical protein [Maribacter sp.]
GNITYEMATDEELIHTDELGKKREYFKNLKLQQRFGLNYFYNTALNMSMLRERTTTNANTDFSPNRLRNKLAISIANILHWFKQRRVESFWGRTTKPDWLPKDRTLESIQQLAERGGGMTNVRTGRYGYYDDNNNFIEVTEEQFERVKGILSEVTRRIRSGYTDTPLDRAARHQANVFEEDTGLDFDTLAEPLIDRIAHHHDDDVEIYYNNLYAEFEQISDDVAFARSTRFSTHWNSNVPRVANEQIVHKLSSVEMPDSMCGSSPFLGDDRYNPDEFLEAYKVHRLMKEPAFVNNAAQRITSSQAFLRYRDETLLFFRYLKKQLQKFESFLEDRELSSPLRRLSTGRFDDDFFTLNNTTALAEIERFKEYFTNINLYLMNSENLENFQATNTELGYASNPINHILDFTNLDEISLNGFPNIERRDKVATFFSRNNYAIMRRELQTNPLIQYPHLYRSGFGRNYTQTIENYARTFLKRNIQKQHDNWICALKACGIYYFYNKFKDVFMTELYQQTDSLFDSSIVYFGVRLMHNTPSDDSRELFENVLETIGPEAYGNLSNEERCYKTVVKEGEV